jgi:hypothetical protein
VIGGFYENFLSVLIKVASRLGSEVVSDIDGEAREGQVMVILK